MGENKVVKAIVAAVENELILQYAFPLLCNGIGRSPCSKRVVCSINSATVLWKMNWGHAAQQKSTRVLPLRRREGSTGDNEDIPLLRSEPHIANRFLQMRKESKANIVQFLNDFISVFNHLLHNHRVITTHFYNNRSERYGGFCVEGRIHDIRVLVHDHVANHAGEALYPI